MTELEEVKTNNNINESNTNDDIGNNTTDEIKEEKNNATDVPKELLAPPKRLQDILCNPEDANKKEISEALASGKRALKKLKKVQWPNMILSDWLWLGSSRDAFDLNVLKAIGITHILNVTREVPNYHILNKKYKIKYCKISIDDTSMNSASIYDFFYAAKAFMDECNPALNDNDNKILVHCAAGISRSSTTIISYLISSKIDMNEQELNRLKYIRECLALETFKHEYKDAMKHFFKIYQEIENNLNETQKNKLQSIRMENYNDQYLKLNEAYYFVKSCRTKISPNYSFCAHLKRLEKYYQNGNDTLCDLPKYTDWDNDTTFWKEARNQCPIQKPDLVYVNSNNCCSCNCGACIIL